MNAVFQFDLDTFRAIHLGWHSGAADLFFYVFTYSGLGQVQVLFALTFLRSKATRSWVVPLITGVIVSGMAFAQGLKQLIPRERPSNLAFAVPQEDWRFQSFPSGHTTTSFCVATLLILLSQGTRYAAVAWLSLPWAVIVGLSRIYRGVHWPTDTLAGACLGVACGGILFLLFRRQAGTDAN